MKKLHLHCFTCAYCCIDCPNAKIEAFEDYFDIPCQDAGLEYISCSDCYYNSHDCDDCLFQYSIECHIFMCNLLKTC